MEPETRSPETHIPHPIPPLLRGRDLSFVENSTHFHPNFHRGPSSRKIWKSIAFNWLACGLDALLVAGTLAMVLAGSALAFGIPVRHLSSLGINSIAFVFFFIGFYQILFRLFLGQTLGEWACHIHLVWRSSSGRWRPAQQNSGKVFLRFSVVLATGVVVLPVLSLLTGRDLAGQISGLVLIHSDATKS